MNPKRIRGPVSGWALGAADALICLGWGASVWVASRIEAGATLRTAALFAHLGALVLGMGAVLTIDYYGVLWLLGRRTLGQLLDFTEPLHTPVWAGLAGLVVSGVLLHPDPADPLTRVKLALVLVVALNGVHARDLHRRLAGRSEPGSARGLLMCGGILAAVSQLGWWGALAIGFINNQS
ncbi:hypothetical protein [Streptomyces iranensis]|uniref:Integral membrane protein n=1 Tax=Streptomyces iranensis TaxID=576784 RepID=A0A061A862_9ACTN|nr:hypothetical protein [Streptomyces iranensis]MBP2067309.1 hypothetical protein [Streptomyces iranensis]CDR15123.1 predicted protein [Streptomyces iranensis]